MEMFADFVNGTDNSRWTQAGRAGTKRINHRWTQMDTDKKRKARREVKARPADTNQRDAGPNFLNHRADDRHQTQMDTDEAAPI
jgi:hypothetical protein